MITTIVVAVLLVLLVLVLRALYSASRKPQPRPADTGNVRVSDARPGDVISIAGAAEDYSDLEFTVDHRSRFDAGPRQWIELRGSHRNRPVSIGVFAGEDDAAFSAGDRRLTLEDLGVSEDQLAEMDRSQNGGSLVYDRKPWRYRMSKEFVLLRDSTSYGSSFYGWLFDEEDGPRTLLIRKPEGEPFHAFVATRPKPGDITVYRAG
ncbi:MAG: hypothetical protein ACE15B_20790 [Bryobacteraceae bacterium]